MKLFRIITFGLISFVLLTSCGKDGKEGDIFIRIVNGSTVCPITSYVDDNPGIPSPFTLGAYYKSNKGVYNYQFTACGQLWSGTYRLEAESGEEAGTFTNGKDGEISRYTLQCWGYNIPDFVYSEGKKLNECTSYPDIVHKNSDGTVIRITREARPMVSADEKVQNNKLY